MNKNKGAGTKMHKGLVWYAIIRLAILLQRFQKAGKMKNLLSINKMQLNIST